MRCIPEYLRPTWWVLSNSTNYGVSFPWWNGAFRFFPVPCPVPCCPTCWHTKLSLLEQPAFTWACSGQAVVSPANSATSGIFTACIPPSPEKEPTHFTTAYLYIHLHVQLLGGFGADCPVLGLILLLSNQGQHLSLLWQWQNHCIKLKYQELFLSHLWNFSLCSCHRIFSRHLTITAYLWLGFWINNSL